MQETVIYRSLGHLSSKTRRPRPAKGSLKNSFIMCILANAILDNSIRFIHSLRKGPIVLNF